MKTVQYLSTPDKISRIYATDKLHISNTNDIISPTTISFITTNRCTAKCKNCCYGCSPIKAERLSLEGMKKILDDSFSAFPSLKLLVLTGGECTLIGDDLLKIIKYATSRYKLKTRIVTNAFWGLSISTSFEVLKLLKAHGLTELNISTGDNHQKWVPYDAIVNTAIASQKLKIPTAISVEYSGTHIFSSQILKQDKRLTDYFNGKKGNLIALDSIWMSSQKRRETNPISGIVQNASSCKDLFKSISIAPNYDLLACCGLISQKSPYLNIGNVKNDSIKKQYEKQFSDFLKIWLYTEGPYAILKFIHKIKGERTDENALQTMHTCEICKNVLSAENIKILEENYTHTYPSIMFKYLFKTKRQS